MENHIDSAVNDIVHYTHRQTNILLFLNYFNVYIYNFNISIHILQIAVSLLRILVIKMN